MHILGLRSPVWAGALHPLSAYQTRCVPVYNAYTMQHAPWLAQASGDVLLEASTLRQEKPRTVLASAKHLFTLFSFVFWSPRGRGS